MLKILCNSKIGSCNDLVHRASLHVSDNITRLTAAFDSDKDIHGPKKNKVLNF